MVRISRAVPYWTQEDVTRWFAYVERLTGRVPMVWPSTVEKIRTFQLVPNEPFREPFRHLFRAELYGLPIDSPQYKRDASDKGAEPLEFYAYFRDALAEVRARERGNYFYSFPPKKVGPKNVSNGRIASYLSKALGLKTGTDEKGCISVSWLIQYELAEVLCKSLNLTPHLVGI